MRLFSVISGVVTVCSLLAPVKCDDDWDEEDDLMVTTDDEVDPDVEEPPLMTEDTTLAEKADAHLSEGERKMRMALCIGIAREKFLDTEEEMEKTIEMMQTIHKMETDQAREMIHINMIKNCYINFNEKEDIPAITAGEKEGEKYKEVVNRLILPPADDEGDSLKQHTLLTRQWDLIKDVVEKERKKQSSLFGADSVGLVGSKMGAFSKFLYFVAVFAAIFGGGYLLVKKLMQLEEEKNNKKNKKRKSRDSSVESVPNKKDI